MLLGSSCTRDSYQLIEYNKSAHPTLKPYHPMPLKFTSVPLPSTMRVGPPLCVCVVSFPVEDPSAGAAATAEAVVVGVADVVGAAAAMH